MDDRAFRKELLGFLSPSLTHSIRRVAEWALSQSV
jgi:hypothetical protein